MTGEESRDRSRETAENPQCGRPRRPEASCSSRRPRAIPFPRPPGFWHPYAMTTLLRVATINILNDLSRWDGRRTLLARGLDALSPDLIALQEVTDPLGTSTAHWLAGELGGYSVHVCPKTGRGRKREGIA